MDEVSVLSWPICDQPIHSGDGEAALSHGDTEWVCLLYPAGARRVNNGTVAIALDWSEARSLSLSCCLGPWYRGFTGLIRVL